MIPVKPEPAESSSSALHEEILSEHMITDLVDDDDEGGEEEIVREIDVFLSPELSEQLHLIQFPLQQKELRGVSGPESARIKPRHCMLELDYPTRPPADEPNDYDYNGQFHMIKRTFSSQTVPVSTHLALGKLIVSEEGDSSTALHLVPLSRITQMRPSFHHVNEATMNMTSTEDDDRQSLDGAGTSRKPLAFQKKESERAALARKSSYAFKKASEDSEAWHSLDVHAIDSFETEALMQKVICPNPNDSLLVQIDASGEVGVMMEGTADHENQGKPPQISYIQSLNYLPNRGDETPKAGDTDQKTDSETSTPRQEMIMSTVKKLVQVMHQGWPIPYSILRTRFDATVPDDVIFEALHACAFLVRGNFVLQSRLMPLPVSVARARTFILFLLQTIQTVHRGRLEQVYKNDDKVTSEAISMLLGQVAKKTAHGWQLKVDDDHSFASKYAFAIPPHDEFWKNQISTYEPLFALYQSNP